MKLQNRYINMTYRSNKIKLAGYNRKAFTFMEVVMAIVILAFVATSILTAMNQCIEAAMDSKTKTEAFEIARENMEYLLSANMVSEKTEFGISETNPDIQWETVIETFTEPITNTMWLQAVCSASYTDKDGEIRSVELTHWLTEVSKDIQKKIKAQKEKERKLMEKYAEEMGLDLDDVEIDDQGQVKEKGQETETDDGGDDEPDEDSGPGDLESYTRCGKTLSELFAMPVKERQIFLENCTE